MKIVTNNPKFPWEGRRVTIVRDDKGDVIRYRNLSTGALKVRLHDKLTGELTDRHLWIHLSHLVED